MCQADANPDPSFLLQSQCSLPGFSGRRGDIGIDTALRRHHGAGQSKDRPAPGQRQLCPLQTGRTKWFELYLEPRGGGQFFLYFLRRDQGQQLGGLPGRLAELQQHMGASGYGILVDPSHPSHPPGALPARYDLATGLGSVNVANLVKNWSSVSFTPTTTPA